MNKKILLFFCINLLLVATGLTVATCVGAKNIPIKIVWDSLFHYEEILDMQLVRDVRIPRALSTIMVGGMLGMAGGMMQGITRNPVAEPSIMGMTQGAVLAVAVTSVSTGIYGLLGNTAAAFLGALMSGVLVLLFSMQSAKNMNLSRLLLAGTALSTFFISIASIVAMLGNRSQELAFWIAGGFRTAGWKQVVLLISVGGLCTLLSFTLSQKINVVSLGDDVSIGLGVNPVRIRIYTVALLIPICAVCVSVAGSISFVGLIVPHIIRKLFGNDYRKIMPLSFLTGSVLLVWSDIGARMANHPYETPIGLFTTFLGIPVFLMLVRKERS